MMLRGGVCVQSRRAAACVCMRPPRRVRCVSRNGQGAFQYVGTMQDELAVGVLAGAVDST